MLFIVQLQNAALTKRYIPRAFFVQQQNAALTKRYMHWAFCAQLRDYISSAMRLTPT